MVRVVKTDPHGQQALVTASSAGIGFAVAECLAELGASVVINGRTTERADRAIGQIHDAVPGAALDGVAADAATALGTAALIAHAPTLDILVNNLGIFAPAPFFALEDADWQRMFETNVISGARLSRHYAPKMRERGWAGPSLSRASRRSTASRTSSTTPRRRRRSSPFRAAWRLANELAGSGVTVNAVLPGPTRSEGMARFLEELARRSGKTVAEIEAEFIRTQRPTSLIRRLIEPEEVASPVLYAASPAASATTSASLRVDGGVVNSII